MDINKRRDLDANSISVHPKLPYAFFQSSSDLFLMSLFPLRRG